MFIYLYLNIWICIKISSIHTFVSYLNFNHVCIHFYIYIHIHMGGPNFVRFPTKMIQPWRTKDIECIQWLPKGGLYIVRPKAKIQKSS
jgi:hypothetical protein